MNQVVLVVGGIVGWLAVGTAAVTWLIYTDKRAFRSVWYGDRLALADAFAASLLGPLMLAYVAVTRLFVSADTARENKARIAEELEKELAAARREIDAMLKRRGEP